MPRDYPIARIQILMDPYSAPIAIDVPLPCTMEYEGIEPLKLPHPNDDVFDRMMCSSVVTQRRVMGTRQHVAHVVTKAILDALGKNDTVRGYTRDEAPDLHERRSGEGT
jgi:hypothetical protein